MINQSETIEYDTLGFDGEKYIKIQTDQILERVSKFTGRLYLEIGGKFMYDAHASRVLPWFAPDSKLKIFSSFKGKADVLFCVNAKDVVSNRQLSNEKIAYTDYTKNMLNHIIEGIEIKPQVVITMLEYWNVPPKVELFIQELDKLGYKVWKRYLADGHPDADAILSSSWYGKSEHIQSNKNLVLVTWAASSSGKMSTCLCQIYLDSLKEMKSGYAKYETFPIRNLSLDHPVNLAYEASTADIGDNNCIDSYHLQAYKQEVVNYNRDVEGFEIVMGIIKKVVNHKNYIRKYKSPTDMGISCAWFALTDDKVISMACLEEIRRRKSWYQQMIDRGEWEQKRIEICDALEERCLAYFKNKWYID